ncbi:hypothetical protein ABZU32_39675 [Sphaerisporangium sp. NPDC005288]|uniref:hypothetical protein n=1 Tax=Sphaerisporangium sp. NPDC005288 TaxID=3155114 RepID=UPI0033AC5F79
MRSLLGGGVFRSLAGTCGPLAMRTNYDLAERNRQMPLVPYPGISRPWHSRCIRCNSEITPRLSNIKAGHGACKVCAGVGRRPRALADEEAIALLAAAGFEALEPYPGRMHAFWRIQCPSCANVMMTSLANIKRKGLRCMRCATHALDASSPALLYLIV